MDAMSAPTTALSIVEHRTPLVPELDDAAQIAALDLRFQGAVKNSDATTTDAILHRKYQLILGDGTRVSRVELIDEARSGAAAYDIQDEDPGAQSVMVWGDTAVVTARLREKFDLEQA